METEIGRKKKKRTHTLEADEENCVQRKKIMHTTLERTVTLEEEEKNCREKSKIDVSFSKRRKGLFGKAARLCKDFNDTRMAILVVSKASRPYAFGHSSVNEVLNDLYHIQPTTTTSMEGHNLMRQQHEQKKLIGVKEEIEDELRACETVEEQAALREKYLKLDQDIKERLRNWSSEETSFQGGVIDQKDNINIINLGDQERSLGSRAGGFTLNGYSGGQGCCLGLGHRGFTNGIGGNPFLASTESNYGFHDGGLTINGDNIDGCSFGLWPEVVGNSLRDSTTGISGNSLLASTTSNYSVNDGGLGWLGLEQEIGRNSLRDFTSGIGGNPLSSTTSNYGVDGDLRSNGDMDTQGCSLGLWHDEVGNDPLRDSTAKIGGNVMLASTTSNYGVYGDLRSNGDISGERCYLGSWHEVSDDPLRDSTSDTIGNFFLASSKSNDGVDWSLGLNEWRS